MESKVITICNRLNRTDSLTGLDVWYQNKIYKCLYKIETLANIVDTKTSVGQVFEILIPFDSNYLPYEQWKSTPNKESYYTLNIGDVLFIDAIIPEIITPNDIINLKNKLKHVACEIRSIVEVPDRTGVNYRFKVSGV